MTDLWWKKDENGKVEYGMKNDEDGGIKDDRSELSKLGIRRREIWKLPSRLEAEVVNSRCAVSDGNGVGVVCIPMQS